MANPSQLTPRGSAQTVNWVTPGGTEVSGQCDANGNPFSAPSGTVNAAYLSLSAISASLAGTAINAVNYDSVNFLYTLNAVVSGSTTGSLSGSIAVQGSNDDVNWNDLPNVYNASNVARTALAVGPGTLANSGSYSISAGMPAYLRLAISVTTGSGASPQLTSSYCARS